MSDRIQKLKNEPIGRAVRIVCAVLGAVIMVLGFRLLISFDPDETNFTPMKGTFVRWCIALNANYPVAFYAFAATVGAASGHEFGLRFILGKLYWRTN